MTSDLVDQSSVQIENLWEELQRIIKEYQRIVENKKKQYEYLKEQDDTSQMCISQYPNVHLQLQNVIESLKFNIQLLSQKKNEQIAKLKVKDINIKEKYKNIKHEFTVTQTIDISQLKRLTVVSNNVLKYLQRIVEKGSMILGIFKICSTLEPLLFNLKKYFIPNAVYAECADANIPESCGKVSNFWEYYNRIKVNNILLKKEGNQLCIENKKLKYKLQSCLTINSGIFALYPLTLPLD
ncbi:Coiled-coil domain-containing protein 65 [Eufriesea mexicana]|uniref:Coiled-coil domain-containing protein 65 n=2 Tax=Eufriesea mexicana TaxID=516756 RepID=A0A310SN81_9HYME|nr:Coiled-coil domain-containing protein 65 [Eufriesea mexicana]